MSRLSDLLDRLPFRRRALAREAGAWGVISAQVARGLSVELALSRDPSNPKIQEAARRCRYSVFVTYEALGKLAEFVPYWTLPLPLPLTGRRGIDSYLCSPPESIPSAR